MKMSRDHLKAIVKECLLEILSEGLGDIPQLSIRKQPSTFAEHRARRMKQDYDPRLDAPVSPGRAPTMALKDAIKREAGGNPIMESIFADTARTTLPSQLAAGDSGPVTEGGSGGFAKPVQQEQFNGSPEDVFGDEVASRWANLAFMEPASKKTA